MLHTCESPELVVALLSAGADPNAMDLGQLTSFEDYTRLAGAVVVESIHPYQNRDDEVWDVIVDADGEDIEVRFDPQSKTHDRWNFVSFPKTRDETSTVWGEEYYGGGAAGESKNFPTLEAPLVIPASSFSVRFKSSGVCELGVRGQVEPDTFC